MTIFTLSPDAPTDSLAPLTRQYTAQGFAVASTLLNPTLLTPLHRAFDALFTGDFETGIRPDEVNWQTGSDPSLTRQICNGWKSNHTIARVVLNASLGKMLATLAGWPGCRIMQDNLLWKPPGAKSLGYHQDSAYTAWLTPSDMITCWIALDDTTAAGGTMELVAGSHRWQLASPTGEFHAPADYLEALHRARINEPHRNSQEPEIVPVVVGAGGGSFHHGHTWHGSGPNKSEHPRRALVIHAIRSDARYAPEHFHHGTGPIYSRYKRLTDCVLDENHFPILWHEDGHRTAGLPDA